MQKKAIIIGAGPAGLTAAYELLKRTDVVPIVLEKSEYIGGISRTMDYKGNRMDMGPHRFFSKSDRVMDWWLKLYPLQAEGKDDLTIHYQNKSRTVETSPTTQDPDKVMLVIQRLTRIYFLRKFFAYPIQLSIDTLRTLGLVRTIKIMFSFLWVRLFPRKPEKSLEDFIINKFGRQLYLLFFKDYTEKVWGVPCHQISAEWGAQRIKGVSLSKAIAQAVKNLAKKKGSDLGQKGTETSLIEQFLYPKKGPGSLWEEVARQVQEMGGKVYLNQDVTQICQVEGAIEAVTTTDSATGEVRTWEGDYFFSTMPVQELIADLDGRVPEEVREIAAGLQYRDFINVGILLKRLSARNKQGVYEKLELKDNWIYIQERDVKVGRLMIYNNWGDGMIKDPNTTWIGMEYFCNKTDDFWALDDEAIKQLAIRELEKMELARVDDVLDITVKRMEKTYPAYFGTYDRFDKVRAFTDQFANLFLVGRNGMHKYNNADHSMLTAMVAVDNIIAGETAKANLWAINTEQEYHEEKEAATTQPQQEVRPSGQTRPQGVPGFMDYLWRNKWNRGYVVFALAAFLIQFVLFKIRYPFANYMPDSYSYLEAAYTNADVNMWPVAYSKFLRQISVFTHSDKVVVGVQYFFMQCSGMVFLFTLLYFLKPGKVVKNILYAFFLFNPVALYVSNYISADALFIGLSLLWLSSLLWVIYQPRRWQIWVHALLLLACFTVRYNAIYYPLISILAFLLSRQSWPRKLAGIGLGVLLVLGSFAYTSNKMLEVTGKRQFSAFGGWQLANNALYMYEHIPAAQRGEVPKRFAGLEKMVREHMDTLSRVKLTHEDSAASFFYLWSDKGPLVQYMVRDWKKDTVTPAFKRWAAEGPLYAEYAMFLIKKYPLQFAAEFLLPNSVKYAVPPPEFLGVYNMGGDSVGQLAKNWFNYKTQKVRDHNNKNTRIAVAQVYPFVGTLVNVFLLICMAGLAAFTGFKQGDKGLYRLLYIMLFLWLLNMGFSIFASPIVLRYQVFPIVVSLCMGVLAAEGIIKWGKEEELKKKNIAI
ncbi:NAD(P)/FAD-dependent oxidoreductase [Flavitalea sp. BT771]|uniref:NAD(P)/FAD-dependent oxidoreductase n=1 Tax=Flavitalea sp. BT771 TaxID=3063329 RepID=UPI0026E434A7|nr:NAD(P)/FAD-dependent oxidoreductase [Flavitalea sp. BT771]MDO6430716.1 NAD(P)/FAD-dependent oxidoreductase [Flavitalea sp. BT771]MDV6219144.1 NAD(P)/FAD-dependent oxidoreductase [Flavitalea sp. BT771]